MLNKIETPETKPKRHIVTIGLTEYFHAGALKNFVHEGHWPRLEARIEQNTLKTLDLLDSCDTKATFFVMGWIADYQPELVQEVARRGHEIANLGYYQRTIHEMTPGEFDEDLKRSRDAIETASGRKVLGYRVARPLFSKSDLWVLDVLARAGYVYDSSLFPIFRSFQSEPWRRFRHLHRSGENSIWEFPFSTWDCLGYMLPIAGGNYFRQFPHSVMKNKVADWDRKYESPFVMYFHVWDLDPGQPKVSAASPLKRLRAYRNLGQMPARVEDYLRTYKFGSVADYLGLVNHGQEAPARINAPEKIALANGTHQTIYAPSLSGGAAAPALKTAKTGVTIVIPCFNEEPVLPYLRNTLNSARKALGRDYDVRVILVDDGSTDRTWTRLNDLFGADAKCQLIKQPKNSGVAASILKGIRSADTEIVCSIDCDCTYDVHQLEKLIPRLTDGVDLVTGSPYHPLGRVLNVPNWRLALSKTASFLYGHVLRQKLHTYTSCFRVYRRSAVVSLQPREGGFLGVPEILGLLDLRGSKIEECPATLEVRIFGESKMKIARTILGHLYLLGRLLAMRMRTSVGRNDMSAKAYRVTGLSKE